MLLGMRSGRGTPAVPAAPVNTVAPVITGTATEGQTLTASTGTWTGSPTPVYTYQWEDDGVPIVGATASTFLLTAAEVGGIITVDVTGTNGSGSATATSAGVGPVASAGGPSINYDLTTGSLPGGTTFTRSTTGTYWDSSGVNSSAAIDTPRFEYNPATLAGPYLLYEPQRTNLAVRSAELDVGDWVKSASSVTADATTSPDGTTNADLIVELATTATHRAAQNFAGLAVSGYVLSNFFKAATRSHAALSFNTGASNVNVAADISAGTLGSVVDGFGSFSGEAATITPIGSGWHRPALYASHPSGTSYTAVLYAQTNATTVANGQSYAGDGSSGVYSWGAQFEAASNGKATSYIPTTTAAVTRGADTLSFTIPSGVSTLTYTFDDNSTQVVPVSPGAYSVPNTLNRWGIKSIVSDV